MLVGGDKGTRTPDFCIANAALYQLSYIPKCHAVLNSFHIIQQFPVNCKMQFTAGAVFFHRMAAPCCGRRRRRFPGMDGAIGAPLSVRRAGIKRGGDRRLPLAGRPSKLLDERLHLRAALDAARPRDVLRLHALRQCGKAPHGGRVAREALQKTLRHLVHIRITSAIVWRLPAAAMRGPAGARRSPSAGRVPSR